MGRHPRVQYFWSKKDDEKLQQLCDERLTDEEIGRIMGRTQQAVFARRDYLGIKKRNKSQYTDEELAYIRSAYTDNSFTTVHKIAEKLNRTKESIRQKIFMMGLSRDGRKTRLATRFGVDILKVADDPKEIQKILLEQKQAVKAEEEKKRQTEIAEAIKVMEQALVNGAPRKEAFQAAMLAGATLQAIGTHQGITRERVRQIVYKLGGDTEPHEAICKGCGGRFIRNYRQQYFCTPECRQNHWLKGYRESRKKMGPRNCARCGTEYMPIHGNQKYCGPACAYLAMTEKVAAAKKQQNAQKAKYKLGNCERCGVRYIPVHGAQRFCEGCISTVMAETAAKQVAEVDRVMADLAGPNTNELIDALPEERQKKVLSRAKSIKQKVKPSRPTLRRYLT